MSDCNGSSTPKLPYKVCSFYFTRVTDNCPIEDCLIINVTCGNITTEECRLCNRNDLFHVLVSCPIYLVLRKEFTQQVVN